MQKILNLFNHNQIIWFLNITNLLLRLLDFVMPFSKYHIRLCLLCLLHKLLQCDEAYSIFLIKCIKSTVEILKLRTLSKKSN